MYKRIVVPLDGSELAEQALPDAEALARLTGAPIHLIRVVDPTQLPWYGAFGMAMDYATIQGALGDEENTANAYLDAVATRLRESGMTVDTELRRGRADRELVAATGDGDVIVMASHGRGGISRWLLGSIAEELLRHATVPILLVRAKKSNGQEEASAAGAAGGTSSAGSS